MQKQSASRSNSIRSAGIRCVPVAALTMFARRPGTGESSSDRSASRLVMRISRSIKRLSAIVSAARAKRYARPMGLRSEDERTPRRVWRVLGPLHPLLELPVKHFALLLLGFHLLLELLVALSGLAAEALEDLAEVVAGLRGWLMADDDSERGVD